MLPENQSRFPSHFRRMEVSELAHLTDSQDWLNHSISPSGVIFITWPDFNGSRGTRNRCDPDSQSHITSGSGFRSGFERQSEDASEGVSEGGFSRKRELVAVVLALQLTEPNLEGGFSDDFGSIAVSLSLDRKRRYTGSARKSLRFIHTGRAPDVLHTLRGFPFSGWPYGRRTETHLIGGFSASAKRSTYPSHT